MNMTSELAGAQRHSLPFAQVNVFSADPLGGNPLAVVHAAEGLSEARMAALARWTNLSETTFLLPATDPGADYYVRIFTPIGELPFAGHPTLGSCHSWLSAGGKPRKPELIVQQCGVGLVRVRRDGPRLAFAAPPLRRTGALEPEVQAKIVRALGLTPSDIVKPSVGGQWPGLVRGAASLRASGAFAQARLGSARPAQARRGRPARRWPRCRFRGAGIRRRRWIRRSGHRKPQRQPRAVAHRCRTRQFFLCRGSRHSAAARRPRLSAQAR